MLLPSVITLPPPPQLCVPLPPFFGAMRSSSFSMRKRLRGAAASGLDREPVSLRSFAFDMAVLPVQVVPGEDANERRKRTESAGLFRAPDPGPGARIGRYFFCRRQM